MGDIAARVRDGTLAADLVGLAAELGHPDALTAVLRPPASDLGDWAQRARDRVDARMPSELGTTEAWEETERVEKVRQKLETLLALAACRALADACPEPLREKLQGIMSLAGDVDRLTPIVVRQIGDLMRAASDDPAMPPEFTAVIVALVRDVNQESETDELPPAIDGAFARVGPDATRAALRREVAPWLLDPEGAPHGRPAGWDEGGAPDEPAIPELDGHDEEALRNLIAELAHPDLVRVLIAIAEVELFERSLHAEEVFRAEAALAAARAWLPEQSTVRNDEAYRAGAQAPEFFAGLAASACARFPHLTARTAIDALAALPSGEMRTMIYERLAEEMRALGYRS